MKHCWKCTKCTIIDDDEWLLDSDGHVWCYDCRKEALLKESKNDGKLICCKCDEEINPEDTWEGYSYNGGSNFCSRCRGEKLTQIYKDVEKTTVLSLVDYYFGESTIGMIASINGVPRDFVLSIIEKAGLTLDMDVKKLLQDYAESIGTKIDESKFGVQHDRDGMIAMMIMIRFQGGCPYNKTDFAPHYLKSLYDMDCLKEGDELELTAAGYVLANDTYEEIMIAPSIEEIVDDLSGVKPQREKK